MTNLSVVPPPAAGTAQTFRFVSGLRQGSVGSGRYCNLLGLSSSNTSQKMTPLDRSTQHSSRSPTETTVAQLQFHPYRNSS